MNPHIEAAYSPDISVAGLALRFLGWTRMCGSIRHCQALVVAWPKNGVVARLSVVGLVVCSTVLRSAYDATLFSARSAD